MKLIIPRTLKGEHVELHGMLKKAILLSGRTGKVAEIVAHILHPHFIKEKKYALPIYSQKDKQFFNFCTKLE